MKTLRKVIVATAVALVTIVPVPSASANNCLAGGDLDLTPVCVAASKVVCKIVAGGNPCLD